MNTVLPGLLAGLTIQASMIVALGPQNMFLLRQGAQRAHVWPIVLFCVLSDVLLVAIGVCGVGLELARWPWLARVLTCAGAVFLAWYGLQSLRRAFEAHEADTRVPAPVLSRNQALLVVAGFTWANPHVYLDTIVVMGGAAASRDLWGKIGFTGGAGVVSVLWFTGIGFGARWLGPWLQRPRVGALVDAVVGVMMLGMAAWLLRGVL